MHGCGNDFVIVDEPVTLDPVRVRAICDRRTGVGADGVIVIGPARDGAWPVEVHNADGSVADACGNGYRCVARYLLDRNGGDVVALGTPGGVVPARRVPLGESRVHVGESWVPLGESTDPSGIAIDLAAPVLGEPLTVSVGGRALEARRVRVGNPNVVVMVDDPATCDLELLARTVTSLAGPANIGVLAVRGAGELELRVHERGAGETLACGTGSCAAVAATRTLGVSDDTVRVRLRGGTLLVTPGRERYTLAGPAEYVFAGTLQES